MRRSVILVGLVLAATACREAAPRPRPNIVLIVVDTLRADHLPCYGYPRDTAPFLTELAGQGVVFEHAYSTSGWTVPATASLFTSLYPPQHGLVENLGRRRMRREGVEEAEVATLPDAMATLPVALQQAGYATFGVSDNFHVSPLRGFDRGFDRFDGASDTGGNVVNKRIKAWRDEMQARAPYFLYVQYMDPHAPYEPHEPWYSEFVEDGKVHEWLGAHKIAAYDSEIRFVDDRIRGLFRWFGWDRDTVVVITADHGEEFGDHGESGHAHSLYAELLDVPLVVYTGDRRFGPRRTATRVGLIDVLPTLREIAGLPADPAAQGSSLVPLLETGSWDEAARPLYSHLRTFGARPEIEMEGVVQGRWKYVGSSPGQPQLFDELSDPGETDNRAAAEPRITEGLAGSYARFFDSAPLFQGPTRTFRLDEETENKLRALGYVR